MAHIPRIMLAGTNSGCGKTTAVCAVLQALTNRGSRVGAFKCGPDYIDPMFHSRIIGAKSANLDLFFCPEDTARLLLAKNGAKCDVSILEGVMGYYDGLSLTSSRASSYHLAKATQTPVVLVVSAAGASVSVLAAIEGFLHFQEDSGIRGVILNHCSAMSYPALAQSIRERFGGRVRPLGYLPKLPQCALESRHLGLVTAAEVEGLREKMAVLAAQAEKSLDLPGMLELAEEAPELSAPQLPVPKGEPVRIGVAMDRAFCFYYSDNLSILEELGAEIVAFSPLADRHLPDGLHGLYLGGGYPELYAETLSRNSTMLADIRRALTRGLPCIAECGGFMYLTEKIGCWDMVGFLPGTCRNTGKLTRFGYVTLTAAGDNLLCKAGESFPAHEFHHWDCTENGAGLKAVKPSGKSWDCAVTTKTLYAGYPHLYFYSRPELAVNYYNACREEKHRHEHDNCAGRY